MKDFEFNKKDNKKSDPTQDLVRSLLEDGYTVDYIYGVLEDGSVSVDLRVKGEPPKLPPGAA